MIVSLALQHVIGSFGEPMKEEVSYKGVENNIVSTNFGFTRSA